MELYIYNQKNEFLGQSSAECVPNVGDGFLYKDAEFVISKKVFKTDVNNRIVGVQLYLK